VIIAKARNERNGMVINPSQLAYTVAQETPVEQGIIFSGIMPNWRR
jgi:hypothetical protein